MIIHKIYWLRPNAIAQQPTKGIKYNEQLLLRINPFFDPTLVTISARFESLSLSHLQSTIECAFAAGCETEENIQNDFIASTKYINCFVHIKKWKKGIFIARSCFIFYIFPDKIVLHCGRQLPTCEFFGFSHSLVSSIVHLWFCHFDVTFCD